MTDSTVPELETRLRERVRYTADAPGSAYKAAAIAAIEAVIDLHKPRPSRYVPTFEGLNVTWGPGHVCSSCWDGDYDPGREPWPCDTVTTIADALGVPL